jgi:hypothetical protein
MILLPSPPRRVTLRAFWIVLSASAGLVFAVAGAVLGFPLWPVAGAVVALGLGVPGWVWPATVERPYQLWNGVAEACARFARLALTGLCFLVVSAAAMAGSPIVMGRTSRSGWFRRPTLPAATYLSPSRAPGNGRSPDGGLRHLVGSSRESGAWWAITLVPLLWLLSMVQTSERGSFGGDIYTLY